jgi:hypothetical protein
LEDVATQAIEEVKVAEAGNRVVEDKMIWWKIFKALFRLFVDKVALALEFELAAKRCLFCRYGQSEEEEV